MAHSIETRHPKATAEGRDLGDEYLIYDRPNACFHVLNGTAREIFLLCDGSRTPGEIASAMAERYGVDEETARKDTERTLEKLADLGALEWA